jgi:hypothetical protein
MVRWITHGVIAAALVLGVGAGRVAAQTNTAKVGVALTASTLGGGIDAATPVFSNANLRVGFHSFTYDHTFNNGANSSDLPIDAELKLQSFDVHFDWFLGHGFHVSPGLTLYNGNKVTGTTTMQSGRKFDLNNVTYYAGPQGITGNASVDFGNFGPSLMLGFGNLIPRGSRHWSIPFELGVIYTRAPKLTLTLNGLACASPGVNCKDINSDPTVNSNLKTQVDKSNNDIKPLQAWPVISLGFSYSF